MPPHERVLTNHRNVRRAIVPIGIMFSVSLICGNLAYIYLSVSFIQMLKVRGQSLYFLSWTMRPRTALCRWGCDGDRTIR